MASMDKIALLELIRKIGLDGDVDFLREGLKVLTQAIMEAEVSEWVGAERFERSKERKNYRNGYRSREWDTRVGTISFVKAAISQVCSSHGDEPKRHCCLWSKRHMSMG